MGFTEKIKDFGRQVIGQGPEVDFKNEAQEYADANHVSIEEAQRDIFFDRMSNLQAETQLGGLPNGTENLRDLQAAINEMFDKQQLEQFKTDSEDPNIFIDPSLAPLDRKDYNRTADYFKKNYDGQQPDFNVVRDSTENLQLMKELLNRVNASRGSARSFTSLEAFLKRYPELGADIGKFLSAQELNDKHENRFDKGLKFDAAIDNFKEQAKDSLTEMFWRSPRDLLKKVLKLNNFTNPGKLFGNALTGITQGTTRSAVALTKFLSSGGRALGAYIGKRRES